MRCSVDSANLRRRNQSLLLMDRVSLQEDEAKEMIMNSQVYQRTWPGIALQDLQGLLYDEDIHQEQFFLAAVSLLHMPEEYFEDHYCKFFQLERLMQGQSLDLHNFSDLNLEAHIKKQVSTKSITGKGKMKQKGTEILETKLSWQRHK
ncbi:hypothetical protein Celaphus_00008437, partial [Cervus elaphus hippelaphus]